MKPLRIRIWMVIGMLIVLIIPRLFFDISGILERYIGNVGRSELQSSLDMVMVEVRASDVTRWRDSQWQDAITKKIAESQLGILLLDASNHEIYRYAAESEVVAERQISMVEHGQLQGTAYFYVPKQSNGVAFIFSIITRACVILFIGWQMGRVVVKPLEAMSMAARQIADGNLDFHLPPSTVLEVANVREAFHAMGNGLRQSLIRQSELEEERRFYISSIAHDLRTPLFTLRGFLLRLENGLTSNPDRTSRYASICRQKADQLARLVTDLFSYSQISSLDQLLRPERLHAADLFTEIVTEYQPSASEKAIQLQYVPPDREQCTVLGDAFMLRRAIGNLIDNALR